MVSPLSLDLTTTFQLEVKHYKQQSSLFTQEETDDTGIEKPLAWSQMAGEMNLLENHRSFAWLVSENLD